jgi:hypothetical protein
MKTNLILIAIIISVIIIFGSCDKGSSNSPSSNLNSNPNNAGKSGSIARFAIVDNFLYTVDSQTLRLFDISGNNITFINEINIGVNIETIFARKNTLFIASSDGVYIYDIANKQKPEYLSKYEHIFSCDPVVTDDKYAYATLNTKSIRCSRGVNQLDIIDISNLKNPKGISSNSMTDPQGLGLFSDNRLIVCNDGIGLYDITNRKNIKLLSSYKETATDVIISDNIFTSVTNYGIANFEIRNDSIFSLGKLIYHSIK